jgi:hypothetical protein
MISRLEDVKSGPKINLQQRIESFRTNKGEKYTRPAAQVPGRVPYRLHMAA